MSNHRGTYHKGSAFIYKHYRKGIKKGSEFDIKPIVHGKILADFNTFFSNIIIFEGGEVTMPCRLGQLEVVKKEINIDTARVDWKISKGSGKIYRHTNDFEYKIKWNRKLCFVKNKKKYSFKVVRQVRKRFVKAIKDKTFRVFRQ